MELTDFAQRVAAELQERGHTKAWLSRETSIPYQRLNQWFRKANARPMGADLIAVAKALNLSEYYLTDGGPKQPFRPTDGLELRAARLDGPSQDALLKYLEFLEQQKPKA